MIADLTSGFSSQVHSLATLFTAFLLGFLGLATSCCNVPVFTAVIGYSGAVATNGKRNSLFIAAIFFLLGVVLTLLLTGLIFSLFGKLVISGIGQYWKIVAGILFIFFGLVTLQLIPIRVSLFKQNKQYSANSLWSAVLFGIVLASSSTVCNSICNPIFSLTLGTAFLQNDVIWGTLILLMFGMGFGLPLALGMAGLSFGLHQISTRIEKISAYIKYGGGVLLLIIGFYFLLTF
jgi:cytochrome c-type biogenesis protein/peptide methionine sulfoxide reductase msrA/msrB